LDAQVSPLVQSGGSPPPRPAQTGGPPAHSRCWRNTPSGQLAGENLDSGWPSTTARATGFAQTRSGPARSPAAPTSVPSAGRMSTAVVPRPRPRAA